MSQSIIRILKGAMEVVLLLLICLSPWALGSVRPLFQFALFVGIAVLLALWAIRMVVEWRFQWASCPVALCLVAFFLLGMGQTIPLSPTVISWLSPETVEFYQEFLPAERETLKNGQPIAEAPENVGSTLSLYPAITKWRLTQILAVFLVFAVVRNNIASQSVLRRLSLAVAINGTLLALFGVVQYYTSPERVIYWVLRTDGGVFGPFINRNHFAFYMNLCIGLGAGYLFSQWNSLGISTPIGSDPSRLAKPEGNWMDFCSNILNRPHLLGLCVMLALMIGTVVFCQSRGGAFALLAGILVTGVVHLRTSGRWSHLAIPLLFMALVLPFVAWFGMDPMHNRYASVWSGKAAEDDRWSVWYRSLTVAQDYPLLGTGYGTFRYVESMARTPDTEFFWDYGHAHNEYVEDLVEGGVARLLLSLLIIGLVYYLGVRALNASQSAQRKGLILGTIWAISTVVFHNLFGFGIHVPANALLITVVAAQLCALGKGTSISSLSKEKQPLVSEEKEVPEKTLSFRGAVPLLAAASVLVLGLVLSREGWNSFKATQHFLAALDLDDPDKSGPKDRVIAQMKAALAWNPTNAKHRMYLAIAHYESYQDTKKKQANRSRLSNQAQASQVLTTAVASPLLPCPPQGQILVSSCFRAWNDQEKAKSDRLQAEHMELALENCVMARDLCPLLETPHVMLSDNRDQFLRADSVLQYLHRACKLVPSDPKVLYVTGVEENRAGHDQNAWAFWNRSLQCSPKYLLPILKQCEEEGWPAKDIVGKVLPRNPSLLLQAETHLFPDNPEQKTQFWREVLESIESQTLPKTPESFYLKAKGHQMLGQTEEALVAYRDALARAPEQANWRFHYAELLFQTKQVSKAQKQLTKVLRDAPRHAQARYLLEQLIE